MIYKDGNVILNIGKKGSVYFKDKLLFIGDTHKAIKLFIGHSNNNDLNFKLAERLFKTRTTDPSNE